MGIRPINQGNLLQHITINVTKNPKIPTNSKSLVVDIVIESLFLDELLPVSNELPLLFSPTIETLACSQQMQ